LCIITKSIDKKDSSIQKHRTDDGKIFCEGRISFHAPKAAGQFTFRIFDQCCKESSYRTLATSVFFNVVLLDYDVTNNLKFVLDLMKDSKDDTSESRISTTNLIKGLTQLPSILKGDVNDFKMIQIM
jgi:hypothetical protein